VAHHRAAILWLRSDKVFDDAMKYEAESERRFRRRQCRLLFAKKFYAACRRQSGRREQEVPGASVLAALTFG
jgi:hypothetical protein